MDASVILTVTMKGLSDNKGAQGLISRVTEIKYSEYPNLIKEMMPLCETSLDLGDIVGLAPILTSSFTWSPSMFLIWNMKLPGKELRKMASGITFMMWELRRNGSAALFMRRILYWSEYGDTCQPEHLAAVKNNICQVSAARRKAKFVTEK